uniref:Coiled-coil domain containing 60 n=1 Tax=Podarcis muralis TaxID=64176 RepID=A0A670KKH3_PODMU
MYCFILALHRFFSLLLILCLPSLYYDVTPCYCTSGLRMVYLINSVKIGRGYFHMLRRETLERQEATRLEEWKEQERRRTDCQPPKYPSSSSSEEDSGDEELTEETEKKKKKKIVRPFTPVYNGLLSEKHPDAHFDSIFRQLCALNWLLEALTLDPNSSMKPVMTCWNPRQYGGAKSSLKVIAKEKTVKARWEHFLLQTKVNRFMPVSKYSRTLDLERLATRTFWLLNAANPEVSVPVCERSLDAKCLACRPRFGKHWPNSSPQAVQDTCVEMPVFVSVPRFSTLLARIPDDVKRDHRTQKVLKKLERFARNPDLRIRPPTFLKVLGELRIWEICSPDICAAVEFLREYIVEMPMDDYKQWLQSRVTIPKRAHSAPPIC